MKPSSCIPSVCSYATSSQYCAPPTEEQLQCGVIPLDSLPASWWNYLWHDANCAINCIKAATDSVYLELNNVLCAAGITACTECTSQLLQALQILNQTIATASVAGAVKSSATCGQVSVATDGKMTANGLGNATQLSTTAKSNVVAAINELKTTYDCCISDINTGLSGKAPTNHASTQTSYGVGTATAYGHVKITDSVSSTSSDTAASAKAVKCAYDVAQAAASGFTAFTYSNNVITTTISGITKTVTLGTAAGCAATAFLGATAKACCAVKADCASKDGSGCSFGTAARCASTAFLGATAKACCAVKADCASKDGSGCSFGTAARCAATAFRPCTWTPSCVACAGKDGSGCSFGTAARYDCSCFMSSRLTQHDCMSGCYYVPIYNSAGNVDQLVVQCGSCVACNLCYDPGTRTLYACCFCGKATCACRDGSGCLFGTAARCATTSFLPVFPQRGGSPVCCSCASASSCVNNSGCWGSVASDHVMYVCCQCHYMSMFGCGWCSGSAYNTIQACHIDCVYTCSCIGPAQVLTSLESAFRGVATGTASSIACIEVCCGVCRYQAYNGMSCGTGFFAIRTRDACGCVGVLAICCGHLYWNGSQKW